MQLLQEEKRVNKNDIFGARILMIVADFMYKLEKY
jgi:hypothetical protein